MNPPIGNLIKKDTESKKKSKPSKDKKNRFAEKLT